MTFFPSWMVIPAAFFLDLCLGDPRFLPHPIRWMGKAIEGFEPPFRKLPLSLTVSGAIFAIALVLGTWATTALLLLAAQAFHPVAKTSIEIVLVYYCLSARSLQDAAMDVSRSLSQNELKAAKAKAAADNAKPAKKKRKKRGLSKRGRWLRQKRREARKVNKKVE